jgi:hypothetical protein
MPALTERAAGPSGPGTVVLELGPGAGALVLLAPAEMNGAEIDISRADQPDHRTHSAVRPRHLGDRTRYAAVYPGLAPGDYTVWHEDGTPAAMVTVAGGAVASAYWPELNHSVLMRDAASSARAGSGGAAR